MSVESLRKGELTRAAILECGVVAAYRSGLSGLSFGELAQATGMSKSGLYAHFGSKEKLQLDVVDKARQDFVEAVIAPAVLAPRGLDRISALFDLWVRASDERLAGGGLFVKIAADFDQQPGPVRERLIALHHELFETITRIVTTGIDSGQLQAGLDAGQFATDLYSIMLGLFHGERLLPPGVARTRARVAFARLLRDSRT